MRKILLCLILGPILALPVAAQFVTFPGTKFCSDPMPHSAIFTTRVTLTGGTSNSFFTTGTTGWFLQGASPDPVMMLVDSAGVIVAFNDDFLGLDSGIVSFTPPATGTFRLIVHSFGTGSAGFTNVVRSVGGGPLITLAMATEFGGTHVMTDWNIGITYATAGGNGDTVLLVRTGAFVGARLAFNDDAATAVFPFMGRLNSAVVPPATAPVGLIDNTSTKAIVGSFSQFTEGQTALCQVLRSWISPLLSPPHDAPRPAPVPNTPEMAKYYEEYTKLKPKLAEMEPDERDHAILELQRRILPEAEIRTFTAPASFATAAYVRAQKEYLERVRAREKELTAMEYEQRVKTLIQMKEETVGRALLKVEPDYGLTWEPEQIAQPAKRP